MHMDTVQASVHAVQGVTAVVLMLAVQNRAADWGQKYACLGSLVYCTAVVSWNGSGNIEQHIVSPALQSSMSSYAV